MNITKYTVVVPPRRVSNLNSLHVVRNVVVDLAGEAGKLQQNQE